ncbi:MAG TPA: hypothetical protein V6C97_15135 [Oculatellaceae cyanobacterium]
MSGNPIMVVSLSVAPEQHAAFTEFYHHQFLPALVAEVPQIKCIRRYEEVGGVTHRLYNKQTITIYELKEDTDLTTVDSFFKLPSLKSVVDKFANWKSKSLRNFSRDNYKIFWQSERGAHLTDFPDGGFHLWSLECRSDKDDEFQSWYQNVYLPLQIADIPSWSRVTRFRSFGREQPRFLTFFETRDEEALLRCLKDSRAAHRINQNYEWQRQVEECATWQESASFRAIYKKPG